MPVLSTSGGTPRAFPPFATDAGRQNFEQRHSRQARATRANQAGLLQGETVYAVYDCIGVGTGFVGITNMRVILQDKSFVGNKLAIVSVPYKNIRSVSMLSNKSMMGRFASTSSIGIDTGGKH